MSKLNILRSEAHNLSGYVKKIIALPLARIDSYIHNGGLFIIDTDFSLNTFEPSLVVIEGTNKTVDLITKNTITNAGPQIEIEVTLSFPGDDRFTASKFLQLSDLKYFVVFLQDINKNENDTKWKILGTKEEPLIFSISTSSNPKNSTIKFKGIVSQQIPWYDQEANPENDLS